MKKFYNRNLNKYTYELFAGDYYVTQEKNVVLTTLLGSCVSVCLKDKITGIVGMNHFMLPRNLRKEEILFSEDARYGLNAMEKMINDMMKLGARRDTLEAKVFGGGKVMNTTLINVSQSNIDFALTYLKMEGIPVLAENLGGKYGRKLFFFPDQFAVYLKRIQYNQTLDDAISREKHFLYWMRQQQSKESELTLFNNGRYSK